MKRSRRRRTSRAAQTESLEQRSLLTTITVTTLADNLDNDNETTLREAIAQANNGFDDTIVFASDVEGVIQLQLGQLEFSGGRLEIVGRGRGKTIIDAGGNSDIISSTGDTLVLRSLALTNAQDTAVRQTGSAYFATEADLQIANSLITGSGDRGVVMAYSGSDGYGGSMEITDSIISGNGGRGVSVSFANNALIENTEISDNDGGGLFVGGYSDSGSPRVTVSQSVIRNNTSPTVGGGIEVAKGRLTLRDSLVTGNEASDGGGVSIAYDVNRYAVSIERSSITNNTATGRGGGVFSDSYPYSAFNGVTLSNVTISGNEADDGGGLYETGGGYLVLENSTILDNTATDQGGGIFLGAGLGGGRIDSNIVAANSADQAPNLSAPNPGVPLRNNFIGSNEGNTLVATGLNPNNNGNLIGSQQSIIDPKLGRLTNVGIQRVHEPKPDSPVISRGRAQADTELDQLGNAREQGGAVDIGSVEAEPSITLANGVLTITGTNSDDLVQLTLAEGNITATMNTETAMFPGSDVQSIWIEVGFGDDQITTTDVTQPMQIRAGAGDDTVKGGIGDDTIYGGAGDDSLRGTKGDDRIIGGSGADTLQGQVGDDTIDGGNGDDLLEGNEDNDRIIGGGGDDTAFGASGRDTITGGGGNDSLVGGGSADTIGGGSNNDTISGGASNDYLNGGSGADYMRGNDGNDTILGRQGSDVLLGEDGDDSISGLTGLDIVYGGAGADTLLGNGHEDILIAGVLQPAQGQSILEHLSGGLRDEWLSNRTYEQRVANVRNESGQTENRLNDVFLIGSNRDGQNVSDDSSVDSLVGGAHLDLFFANEDIDSLNRLDSETLEPL